jgi:hypothetical protein
MLVNNASRRSRGDGRVLKIILTRKVTNKYLGIPR